ncbi:glycosyltransferase [Oleiharenicola sp. Vm1]|uniref:glycosyltransferase n=1 Tax=Oleiharenicola sp. Vm1 TaxID=3398393 RepID=UPI0039F453AB
MTTSPFATGSASRVRYFCTYFDHNYLPQGLALYYSLRRHCPGMQLFVLCLSEEAREQLRERRLADVTTLSMAEFAEFDPELFAVRPTRSAIEFIFTCTASLCRWVLARHPEVELLTYLDADLYFFSDVEPMFTELGDASIGIIPHRLGPSGFVRRFGRFNVGWISFRRDANGLACVERWRQQCIEWCYDRVEPTRFADQKYLDEWPATFAGVHVYTHPGANLARWNYAERKVRAAGGQVSVDGRPLVFFHFASFKQLSEHVFESAFSTHWIRPDRVARQHILGPYIAELRHVSGPLLPRGPRRLFGSRLNVSSPTRLLRELLVLARSLVCWDFVIVLAPDRQDARYAHMVGPAARPAPAPAPAVRRKVWFAFADAKIHSGQREASRLTYTSLDPAEWDVRLIVMPGFEHNRSGLGRWVRYFTRLIVAWLEFLPVFLQKRPVVHMNIGQTKMSMVRDGVPLRALHWLKSEAEIILMTQGSVFMSWQPDESLVRVFRGLVEPARLITVLGPHQAAQLRRLGIPAEKVIISNNTCGSEGIDEAEIIEKQARTEPISLLHLSTLIDTKGFPEYLEALELLASRPGPRIQAIICGRVLVTEHSQRFRNHRDAEDWIRNRVERINQSSRVSVRWMAEGADGETKWLLYRGAQVFVLPSYYPVEAQPIVNIEAMAHGCAIISTTAGEIEAMFDGRDVATILDEVTAQTVAEAIEVLVADAEKRVRHGLAARRLFERKFSPRAYATTWKRLLTDPESKGA